MKKTKAKLADSEFQEDKIWEAIIKKRDTKNAKFISHKKAWA